MDQKRDRFEAQVLPHLDAAYRFARWLSASPADADDLVQEAVLRAYRGLDSLRGIDAKPWLLSIVKNCHATAFRHQRNSVPLPEEDDVRDADAMIATTPGPEHESIQRDHERLLNRVMSTLPEVH